MIMARHMKFQCSRVIPADHPSLPGHFPRHPIVPGVVILDEVFAALRDWQESISVKTIPSVKFLVPLKPEQPFTISFCEMDHNQISFSCRVESQVVVQGQIGIDRKAGSNS